MYKMQYSNYKNPNIVSKGWSTSTITNILKDRIYIGDLIQHKYSRVNYKIKKIVKVNKENLIIIENSHESIISKKDFLKVQQLLMEKANENKRSGKTMHILTGITYCKKCGSKITYTKNHGANFKIICSNYKKNGKKACDNIYLDENNIIDNIKKDILEEIKKQNILNIEIKSDTKQEEINKLKQEKNNNINSIKQIYNDVSKKVIGEDMANTLIKQYVEENNKIEDKINIINKNLKEKEINIIEKIKNVDKTELRSLIYSLINKIELSKEEITIHYKFTPS